MRWNCILGNPHCHVLQELDLFITDKSTFKFLAMNPNTKRNKKFRKELKKDPEKLEVYLKKDRERKKQYHEKMARLSVEEREKLKEKDQLRKKKERKRKKIEKAKKSGSQNKFVASTSLFISPQSLGKAVHRVKSSLPKSPKKVPVVISKIVEDLSPRKRKAVLEACDNSCKRKKPDSVERKKRSDALTEEEANKVEEFFMRDDISRICPGKKDFVSVKTPSGRVQKQKRLLLLNIHEAYEVFKEENDIKIGKSKFASLRPAQVTPMTSRVQDVFICKYHENIDLILSGLAKLIPGIPNCSDSLLDSVVCSHDEASCMDGACSKCGDMNKCL